MCVARNIFGFAESSTVYGMYVCVLYVCVFLASWNVRSLLCVCMRACVRACVRVP